MSTLTGKCQQIFMPTFFTTHPGKSKMKITTIQIFINHSHGICPPIAIAGFINIVPYLQMVKNINKGLKLKNNPTKKS